jgi:hypothetical protein
MVKYFYTQGYDADPCSGGDNETTRSHNPFVDINVNVIADKYGIAGLKALTEESFRSWAAGRWGEEEFAKVVYDISQLEHQTGLLDTIVDVIAANRETLLEQGEIVKILESSGRLTLRVLRRVMEIEAKLNKENLAAQERLRSEIRAMKGAMEVSNHEIASIQKRLGTVRRNLEVDR